MLFKKKSADELYGELTDGELPANKKNKLCEKLYNRALKGDGDACYRLYLFAEANFRDHSIDIRYTDYIGLLRWAVELGNPHAMYVCAKKGYCKKNEVIPLLEKAAANGADEACLLLARIYENCLFGYKFGSLKKLSNAECAALAVKYLTPVAEKGNAKAQVKLGNILSSHIEDINGAVKWFEKAAEQNDSEGYLGLGRLYRNKKEYYKAQKYLRLAADAGNGYAQLDLGELLLNPELNDVTGALGWLQQSAESGNYFAMRRLSEIYGDGKLVDKDDKKSLYWDEKGYAKGDDCAAYNLALRYLNGKGVVKDEKKAIVLLKWSAGKYNQDAVCELGFCYFNGIGVEKNSEKAERMFLRASGDGNNPRADYALKTWFNK